MSDDAAQGILVDTNIFLRFLTGDDPAKAAACRELFESAERKEVQLHTNDLILAELVWTLRSFYRRPKEEIIGALRDIAGLSSLRIPRRAVLLAALDLYERFNVDFLDAYNTTDAQARGISFICSYDAHYDRLGIKRVAPGKM
ncbi:MAG: PIN domain-containing protein [Dehalococcoidia bacterium]|nr:PIN domain-containing protein [Dehalococcoidia bacterium]